MSDIECRQSATACRLVLKCFMCCLSYCDVSDLASNIDDNDKSYLTQKRSTEHSWHMNKGSVNCRRSSRYMQFGYHTQNKFSNEKSNLVNGLDEWYEIQRVSAGVQSCKLHSQYNALTKPVQSVRNWWVVLSFPGSRFPGARDSRQFSFPDSRELKRRHSREKMGTSKRQLFIKWDARQLL